MSSAELNRLTGLLWRFPKIAAVVSIAAGALVLLGWLFDMDTLKSGLPGLTAMKANTALAFILSGVALWGGQLSRPGLRIVSQVCASVVLLLGLLTLGEYLSGVNFGIDQLLIQDITNLPGDIPGRMAVNTALSFAALGAALLLLSQRQGNPVVAIHALAIVPIIAAGSALIGYAFDIEEFLRAKLSYTPMAANTAMVFVLLTLGVVTARPDYPFRRLMTSGSAAGVSVRRLLPSATGFTFVTGWLILQGYHAGYFNESFGLGLFAATSIAGLSALILWNAEKLYEAAALREQAEESLSIAYARFSTIFNQAPLGIALIDSLTGQIHEVNPRFAEIAGRTIEEMATIDWMSITHPDDVQADLDNMALLNAGKIPGFRMDKRYLRPDGSFVWINMTIAPLREEQNSSPRHLCMIDDITERKQAERDIQRLNQLYSLLSRTNKMIVRAQDQQMLFDEACRIAVDQGSFRMSWIGVVDETTHFIKPVAMYGNFGDYLKNTRISVDDVPEGRGPTGTALREGRHFVCRDIEHDPYMAPWREAALAMGYRSSAAFPLWVGGAVKGAFTVYAPEADWFNDEGIRLLDELSSDISYALDVLEKESLRKQAEEEVRRLNAELEQRVMERTAELEAFSYSVSHDLRTPLRAIDGFSRLVLKQYEGKLDDEGKRLLNVVRDNTKKMGQLIDDILAFSRAGRLEIKTAEVDMEALARDVWQELEPSMAGRDVRLEIKPLPKVQGDPAMLRQVWVNLLGNAAKFTNPRTTARIEVGSSTEGNERTFYVKDNGVGFDQQYVGKLFGVFQRLHGVAEFEGTGIGLAIVKRIVIRHGGRVWAEGKVGEGATVYFTLPAKEKEHGR